MTPIFRPVPFRIAWAWNLTDNASVDRAEQREAEGLAAESVGYAADPGHVIAAIAGLAAVWIAAGSTGLLAHPLRRALTLLALAVAILVHRPPSVRRWMRLPGLLAVVGLAAYMIASSLPVINIMGVTLVLAFLAFTSAGQTRRILCVSSAAAAVLGLYRLACTSIPWVCSLTDWLGGIIGNVAGLVARRPLNVGAAFAGLDFLVLMSVLWAIFSATSPPPRRMRTVYGYAAIIGGHLCYLIMLAFVPDVLAAVPEPAAEAGWSWAGLFHKAVPWNLPSLACGVHLLIATAMFRWTRMPSDSEQNLEKADVPGLLSRRIVWFAVPLVAILLPVVTALHLGQSSLQGKKIVFYEKGFLNWLKPEHGQYGRFSSGMYGMLPVFVESLGASSSISSELSQEDLKDADVLVLIFPDELWGEGQLDRVWDFVRQGGSLLVLGEHTTRDPNGSSRFNEVLEPTAMRVQFDSATFAVGGWLQTYEVITHPMTAGIPDDRNQFGVVIGASLDMGWPARPVLIGRWGWSDPGDEGSGRAMMGNGRYDPGEKLGDLILIAEQPLGKGRVVAFGDTSSITNGINVGSHVFTSRLFGYLAHGSASPHAMWRQMLGILTSILLIGLLIRQPDARIVFLTALCLAGSLAVCNGVSRRAGEILPDGRYKSPNNLAYIDSSHVEAYSGESWRPDGVGGFALTLMRNGYMTLSLSEFTAERLEKASLLISVAPSREFSQFERAAVKGFVTKGGTFVIMVGRQRMASSRSLLSEFGFAIGAPGADHHEPEAMGHFKSPYLESAGKRVYVRFHAAWPITCSDSGARVIAYGRNNVPVIMVRRLGAGKVAVIGDTFFATNKNLEREGGEPFEGLRENADFWRWFITQLRDQEPWIPPALQPESSEDETVPAEVETEGVD